MNIAMLKAPLKNMRSFFFLLCFAIFFAGNCPPAEAVESILHLSPEYNAIAGSTVTISVYVENPRQLYGCSFVLRYDEDIIRAKRIIRGELLYANGNTLDYDLGNADRGSIFVDWLNEYHDPVPYGGALLHIEFTVLNEGSTSLIMENPYLRERNGSGYTPYTISSTISTWSLGSASPQIVTGAYLREATRSYWYSTSLSASGGRGPYSWSRISGSLPPGLNLSSNGVIDGTPTSTGNYTFTVRVTDEDGRSTSRTFYLDVYDIGETFLTITSNTTLSRGRKGSAYSVTLSASGGRKPYRWSRISGSLPPGLRLSSDGVISGTPASTGNYMFTIRVTDDNYARRDQQFWLTITDKDYTSDENHFMVLNIQRGTMGLNLSPEEMPYTMIVNRDVNWVNLAMALSNPSDRLRINGTASYDGIERTVPLSKGNNLITIGISAAGDSYRNYTLTIYRLP